MQTRYNLVIKHGAASDSISCYGHLPRVGERVVLSTEYANVPDVTYIVTLVTYAVFVEKKIRENFGTRGREYEDRLPEVRVRPE